MSKKTKEKVAEEKLAAMNNINPFDYGYKPGSSVSIPSELFMAILEYTQVVLRSETKEYIETFSTVIGAHPSEDQPQTIRIMTSPIGKRSEDITNGLLDVHYQNIDNGHAISEKEVQLDFGDEPNK